MDAFHVYIKITRQYTSALQKCYRFNFAHKSLPVPHDDPFFIFLLGVVHKITAHAHLARRLDETRWRIV